MQNLQNIKPVQRLTNATYGRAKIVELNYPKRKYTKSDMEKLIKIQQDKYKGEPLMLMPSIRLQRGYRSMKAFSVDQNNVHIDLYGEESEESEHFCIYMWKTKEQAGGTDEHNDCLYDCMLKALNLVELPKSWNTKTKFKIRLGLERNDKVHVDKISIIEEALNININITGDYTYTSPHTHSKTANIKLVNGHYYYDTSKKSNDLIRTISFKDQKIYFAYECLDNVLIYDGKNEIEMSYENYYEIKNNIFGDIAIIKATKQNKIIEEYMSHVKYMREVKEKSNNLIDYKNCGGSHKNAVLKLFYNMSKGIEDPEQITELEEEWLKDTFQGGLIFGESITLENATSYDVNSAYPSILKHSGFKIPVKQGDFQRITEITDIIPYGIYRCVIKRSGNYHTDKLFKFNSLNKYTHTDIYVARKLKLDVGLIIDDEANCLLYGAGKCVNGARMFKTIIDYLYNLKLNNVKYGKIMMNTLWGALCEKSYVFKSVYDDKESYNIPEDCTILSISPTNKGNLVSYSKKGRYFKLSYARFGPFLTSVVRKLMTDTIYSHKELVHRCHTDGFITQTPIDDIELSSEIGKFKIEKQGKCIIKNSMEVIWF
jgi:hypothetical protein